MALFALTDLAAFLQQDLDTASATVAQTIAAGVIEGYTGQAIEQAGYSHILPVAGGVVRFPQRPVTAVASVTAPVEGALPVDRWDWDGVSPWLYVDTDEDAVTVSYTAGYPVVPDVVKAVALAVAARAYSNPQALKTESIDDYAVTYGSEAPAGLLDVERVILSRYRAAGSVRPA